LVPDLDGPIYKGIFSDMCLLLSASNFPIMIAYSLPSLFSRVRFEQSTYARYLVCEAIVTVPASGDSEDDCGEADGM
jgi:hypothetical protein